MDGWAHQDSNLVPAGPDEIRKAITQYDAEVGGFESASLQVNFGMIPYAEAEASMNCSPAR
jgi:hypothetical protein